MALFVALSGSAAAATAIITDPGQIADNVIHSNHIADGTITGADIGFGAVGTADLAAGSVTASQLYDQSVTNAKLASAAVTGAKVANGTIAPQNLVIDPNHVFGASGPFAYAQTPCGTANALRCEWHSDAGSGHVNFTNGPLTVFVDPAGVVHLSGQVCYAPRLALTPPGSGTCAAYSGDNSDSPYAVTTLPAGYRPPYNISFANPLVAHDGGDSFIAIGSNGQVYVRNATAAIFDGITFRNR
jgi:hypothetical protein